MTIKPQTVNTPAQHGRWIIWKDTWFISKQFAANSQVSRERATLTIRWHAEKFPIGARKSHSHIYCWLPLVIHARANAHTTQATHTLAPVDIQETNIYTYAVSSGSRLWRNWQGAKLSSLVSHLIGFWRLQGICSDWPVDLRCACLLTRTVQRSQSVQYFILSTFLFVLLKPIEDKICAGLYSNCSQKSMVILVWYNHVMLMIPLRSLNAVAVPVFGVWRHLNVQ